jgi:hypothetical protein
MINLTCCEDSKLWQQNEVVHVHVEEADQIDADRLDTAERIHPSPIARAEDGLLEISEIQRFSAALHA